MNNKPTDSEIVKALECCVNGECPNCPLSHNNTGVYNERCGDNLMQNVLDLINRQQAENDRKDKIYIDLLKTSSERADIISSLKAENERLNKTLVFEINSAFERGKAEAYKEFAEKFENRILSMLTTATLEEKEIICACIGINNNVLKELVGENK